jgi:hypothetical protein
MIKNAISGCYFRALIKMISGSPEKPVLKDYPTASSLAAYAHQTGCSGQCQAAVAQ